MSINFLLDCVKFLHDKDYLENEKKLFIIYDFIVGFDNETIELFTKSNTFLTYNNDLELYLEIVDVLIKVFEDKEDYEKCSTLKNKKEESLDIMFKQIN